MMQPHFSVQYLHSLRSVCIFPQEYHKYSKGLPGQELLISGEIVERQSRTQV